MSEEKDIIAQASEVAGIPLTMEIRDGEFRITPSDAGVMLLAAVSTWQEQAEKREDYIEQLLERLEKLRDENATYRDLLEECRQRVIGFGYEEFGTRIMNALWPVVGVLDDGTEVTITMDWNEDK